MRRKLLGGVSDSGSLPILKRIISVECLGSHREPDVTVYREVNDLR